MCEVKGCERSVIIPCCLLGNCRGVMVLESLLSGGVAAPLYLILTLSKQKNMNQMCDVTDRVFLWKWQLFKVINIVKSGYV